MSSDSAEVARPSSGQRPMSSGTRNIQLSDTSSKRASAISLRGEGDTMPQEAESVIASRPPTGQNRRPKSGATERSAIERSATERLASGVSGAARMITPMGSTISLRFVFLEIYFSVSK